MTFRTSRAARARVLPFVAFMLLLALRGALPPAGVPGIDPRWIYGLTVLVVGGMLLAWRTEYGELARQNLPDARQMLWAVAVGMLLGLCTRTAGLIAIFLMVNFALGGYYDASLIVLNLIALIFVVLPTGHWWGLDRRLHQRHPKSIWFR